MTMTEQTAAGNGAPPAGDRPPFVALAFSITWPDGSVQNVTSRPGDLVRLQQKYGTAWRESDDLEPFFYLAWLASRHDDSTPARPDLDAFLDDVVNLERSAVPVDPTDAARGNGSPSSWQLPPEPTLPPTSTPTPAPS